MRFFSSVRKKIFLTVGLGYFLVISIYSVFELDENKTESFEFFDGTNQVITEILTKNLVRDVYEQDWDSVEKFLQSVDSKFIKKIYLLSIDGKEIIGDGDSGHVNVLFRDLLAAPEHEIKNETIYARLEGFTLLDIPMAYMIIEGNLETYHERVRNGVVELAQLYILSLMIGTLLAYILSKTISSPLEAIKKTLERSTEATPLKLGRYAVDEFDYLSETIEAKHNTLIGLNQNLEEKVRQKTAELRMINEGLERKVADAVREMREKDKMLQQQSRLAQMGEMISMIAHQWRQPLGSISAAIMNIQTKRMNPRYDMESEAGRQSFLELLDKKLKSVTDYVQFLSTTIDDFRNFFKPNKTKETVSLSSLVQKTLGIIQNSIVTKGIAIKTFLAGEECVHIYQNEMVQVILNILKNAEDALVENRVADPEIRIYTKADETHCHLQICDNGGGIDPDIMAKIFDPYFSTKSEKNGTGLGLYMSRTMVHEHNGGVLKVTNENGGACFEIILQRADQSGREESA